MHFRLSRTIKVLAGILLLVFIAQQTVDQFLGGNVQAILGLVPSLFWSEGRVWQILTYAFLHADVLHLFFNLMILVFIGGELESTWGTKRFLGFSAFCAVGAAIGYLLLQGLFFQSAFNRPLVGASGALYGMLLAYGILFSERTLLFMMVFPLKAKHFVWVLMGLELMTSIFSGSRGLSSVAHLGGLFAGMIYLLGAAWIQKAKREGGGFQLLGKRASKKKKIQPQHLKLVINNRNEVELKEDRKSKKPPTFH